MDEVTRRREADEVDAGLAPAEVLRRTVEEGKARLDEALADLTAVAGDEELLQVYGLDMSELRREVDWDQVWTLP